MSWTGLGIKTHHTSKALIALKLTDVRDWEWSASGRGPKPGLFLSKAGHQPKRLVKGIFASPVVAPGGRWAIASRAESGWAAPNEVVRIDLSSGKVYPVAIARAENLDCLAFLPERGFLVFSSPDQPVKGEFSPCHSLNKRPLQPTGKAGEFWATRPTEAGVELGRYRLKDFQFTPVRSYAGIRFGSSSIWVSGKSLFAVVDGNVLELPIH